MSQENVTGYHTTKAIAQLWALHSHWAGTLESLTRRQSRERMVLDTMMEEDKRKLSVLWERWDEASWQQARVFQSSWGKGFFHVPNVNKWYTCEGVSLPLSLTPALHGVHACTYLYPKSKSSLTIRRETVTMNDKQRDKHKCPFPWLLLHFSNKQK